jgi:hypothetical protein
MAMAPFQNEIQDLKCLHCPQYRIVYEYSVYASIVSSASAFAYEIQHELNLLKLGYFQRF